jgi:hypothetical protein
MQNRIVMAAFGLIAPIFTWIICFLIPGRSAKVAYVEAKNKAKIMKLVNNLHSYMDPEGKTPIQTIVEKCYAQGSFPALWAVEGLGKDIAEWHMARNENPVGILTNATLDQKWDGAWLMLHAGLGLGFAKFEIEKLKADFTDADIKQVVKRTVDLCRANSQEGYYGAAIESLGLASRFLHNPDFCLKVHKALLEYAPDSVGFFWRGVGRSVYFHPLNFLPGFVRPSRAIHMCEIEAPNVESKEGMLSGIAWALTVVNMTDPMVMEWVLENHDDYFSGSPGFFDGVVSTVVMRYDTTPDDPLIQQFMTHKPNPNNRTLGGLWNSKIKGSLQTALDSVYPVLKKTRHLDQVFQYQSLPALAARLKEGDQMQRYTTTGY